MGIIERLADLAKSHPKAQVVAFADLSSSMILASQGNRDITQEHLDRLCRQARHAFDDPLFSLSVEAFGEPHGALILGPDHLRLFLRSEADPADALCCICDHGIDLAAFVAKIRQVLDEISVGG